MRVLILYNEPILPLDHPDSESERDILSTVEVVAGHLTQAGHEASRLGLQREVSVLLETLRLQRPDVVFNLYEGLGGAYETEAYLGGLLEWLGIPFTGCPAQAMMLARSKVLTKLLLRGAGLPTPDSFVVESLPVPDCPLNWPVIVKPANVDASIGLDQGSVVSDPKYLSQRVAYLLQHYGPPVLVEQFIRGREFNIGLIENPELRALPVAEILFLETDPAYWPIVTYDAKWKTGSRECELTPPRCPAEVSPQLAEQLRTLACQAFRLLGCRDYARVDFRVSPSLPAGQPYVLEVNPNPDYSPAAGFANGLRAAGLNHPQFTLDLVAAALARGK